MLRATRSLLPFHATRRLATGLGQSAAKVAAAAAGAEVPDEARVVIIGGGIIGTSVAYHLGKMGYGKDVVLLERDQLTCGTTWHAAGLCVTFGSLSETMCTLRKQTRELYKNLEEETGLSTGFMPVGFIELAANRDRLEEYRRVAAFNRIQGIPVEEISPSEVRDLQPMINVDDILAGFYVKEDGRVNPVDATMSMAKGARMHGVRICKGVMVDNVIHEHGKVTGVKTTDGKTIKADKVINCAGMWARQLGAKSGVSIPLQSSEHYYLLTDEIEGVDPHWPIVEDPASYTYIRPEGGGMMVGLFEPEAAAWSVDAVPDDFSFGELPPDWERMTPYIMKAMSRMPATLDAGIRLLFNGPESFTPDLSPCVGESPELRDYYVCAGLNSIGILCGGGMGRLMAQWMMDGRPDLDVTGFHIDRLQPCQSNKAYRASRVVESLGMVYKCHYPAYAMKTARGAKVSGVHARMEQQGAYFRDVSGWESPDWFAPPGVEPVIDELTWNRHNFFPYWEEEHKACREGVILMDMSFMAKFAVQGPHAGKSLNFLSTANVDQEPGMMTYCQWLDEDGHMQADVTVAKLDENKFQVIVTDTMHRHAHTWLERNLKGATVTDVTGAYTQLNVQGPLSRKMMELVTDADMSNEAFPFRAIKDIEVGFARVMCARITYLGELGYELYIPTEQAMHVYDILVEKGEQVGMKHAGLKALSSLRMEKAYRDYGHDMDNTDTLLEVGLGFTADYEKEGGFMGMEATLAQKEKKLIHLPQRLCQVLVKDPEPFMFHGEPVYRNGECVGDIRAASYGHTLGGAVGLAMIKRGDHKTIGKKFIEEGEWTVDIAGTHYPAKVSLQPMYDPKSERVRM